MAAAVMAPIQGLSLDGGIMPPSPASQNNSRHGRSKHGGSVAKKGRGRAYSVVDEREVTVSKALAWVLKRTIQAGEKQEEGTEEKLVADADGWVDCEEVLERKNLKDLEVSFEELHSVVTSPKSRFAVKLKPDSEEEEADESDYLIRMISTATPPTPSAPTTFTQLTTTTEDLPELIVYETSYRNYPLILASGGLKRAGGQAHLQFAAIKVNEDGTEEKRASDVEVSIYLDLRSIMEAEPSITWARTETGSVVTAGNADGELDKKHWKKAVARRGDIGILFEDGVVKKEVPVGLRGKGAKGKKGLKGKGAGAQKKEMKATSDDDFASD